MQRLLLPAVLGLAHGIADAAAGFLLGTLPQSLSLEQSGLLILLYNGLAFGYQPLVGMVTDKIKRPRLAVLMGLLVLSLALFSVNWQLQFAVILAGMGSAAFHVGGGAIAVWATPKSTLGAGLFAAPGVVGLAVGGALGFAGYEGTGLLVSLLLIVMGAIALMPLPKLPYRQSSDPDSVQELAVEDRDLLVLVVLSAIALTSLVWTSFDFMLRGNTSVLIAMAVAAAVGKILGGSLATRWGWRLWTVGTLTLSTLLLALGGHHLLTLLPAMALLQSSIPVTLAATAHLMPEQPATGAGFALGLAIAIGGIPVVAGLGEITSIPVISAVLVMVVMVLLGWVLNTKMISTTGIRK
ncbi:MULTISPECIES: MFS transporter [unclassified Coleofasciculus]|uniref:MFS transporter n=1 Tax=unclassified Coleofasciculus TaxID=2692782 RepID=UPI00187F1B85|nr:MULTISPECIES: MFS transporter [unclassified Coleofasciculus]MBE9127208.1 MFS transporter [Coleofasciculus sp. LEGE 07081]MBE9150318.1 MFS transporter [Coleofasciculus sp. LEGE 07092]